VLSEKKILNETKSHNPPPCKLNGRSLKLEARWTGIVSFTCRTNQNQELLIVAMFANEWGRNEQS